MIKSSSQIIPEDSASKERSRNSSTSSIPGSRNISECISVAQFSRLSFILSFSFYVLIKKNEEIP